jgi:hypothetical protein
LKGNWDSVIRSCDSLQLPMPKAIALYEQARSSPQRPSNSRAQNRLSLTFLCAPHQLVLELLEVQELELARGILRSTPAMLAMKQVRTQAL